MTETKSAETLEFEAQWGKLALIINALDTVELQKLRRTVEHAETVGPILVPTEWRAGRQNLADQRRILEAAIKLKDAGDAIKERA